MGKPQASLQRYSRLISRGKGRGPQQISMHYFLMGDIKIRQRLLEKRKKWLGTPVVKFKKEKMPVRRLDKGINRTINNNSRKSFYEAFDENVKEEFI